MCKGPNISIPAVKRLASPQSDSVQRESEMERRLRRSRRGVAADILTSPLGILGPQEGAMQ